MKDWIIKTLGQAFQNHSELYNLRRRQLKYSVEDLVLTRNRVRSSIEELIASKLNPEYIGPFRFSKVLSSVVCGVSNFLVIKVFKVH